VLSDLGRAPLAGHSKTLRRSLCLGLGKGRSRSMKKSHVFGCMVFAVVAFSVMMAASAFAATLQWLANGKPIATPQSASTIITLEIGNETAIAGFKLKALCVGTLDGTVGPGGEDMITEVLERGNKIELGDKEMNCINDDSCPSPLVSPIHLPWLTHLELMGTEAAPLVLDVYENGGKGEPGWELMCEEPLIGLIEETCESVAATGKLMTADLENDPAENDVLGTIALEEILLCSGNDAETGYVSTHSEPFLFLLLSGEPSAVSYE
jgi:hypothetical protein